MSAPATPLTISVIVPVYNGRTTLPGCLQALRQQTHPPDEIIVVDDGSTDGSAELAVQFGVTVLSQPNAGPAAARNRGGQHARGDLLLFTDADCAPAADWVARMVAPFADSAVIGAKGVYRTRQTALTPRFVQQEYQERYDRMAGRSRIDFVDTYAAAYRRDVFLSVGGFDPAFRIDEDQELSFRLAAQGQRLVFAPEAVVYHWHVRSLPAYVRRKYQIGYWKARVTRRYPAKLVHDSHTPQSLKIQLGLAGLGGLLLAGSGWFRSKRLLQGAGLAWLALLLSAWPLYQKIWRRDRAVLLLAPVLVFVRAWALGWGFLLGNFRFFRDDS